MKKHTKFLSILLCLSMLIGLVTMVATAQGTENAGTPNAVDANIKQGINLEIVSPTRLTTAFGYYADRTGDNEYTFVRCGEGAYLTDGWYGRPGVANCTSRNGLIAAIIEVNETINFGGIEIVANDRNGDGDGDLMDFDVQAWVDGKWVEVLSVATWPHSSGRTVKYTFDAVETSKVRMLINKYYDGMPKLKEITLFEEKTGNLVKKINLNGNIGESDASEKTPANNLVDGNKANTVLFSDILIDVVTKGDPVPIDGFILYPYMGDQDMPSSVTISVLTADGSVFEPIGTYDTGWRNKAPLDPLVVTFEQPYIVYAIVVNIEYSFVSEFELFQFERKVSPQPPTKPTDPPTEPSETPTEPSVTPTEPSETPTEPSETPTEPSETPTEPTETPTEPSETPTEPTETPTEPSETPTEPSETPADPTDPTEAPTDPTDPTEAPTVVPTEAPTKAPAVDKDAKEEPKSNTVVIIVIIVAVAAVAGGAVLIIKKKKI